MKCVVIVGADFAPSSLPPALRIRFFAQHLPEFGWEPIVLTTDPQYYDWPVDPENERLLPEGLKVLRTPALPARLTQKLGIGDIGLRSLWHHWRALVRLCRGQRVDLIFIPVPPYFSMVLGRLIYQQFGIPYVIDYIDPWVTEYYWNLPREQRPPKWMLADLLSRTLEPFALKKVSHLVGVAEAYMDGPVARYSWLAADDVTGIPYGGEPADFAYLHRHPRPNRIFDREDGHYHICYVGRGGPDMVPALRAVFQALRLGLQRSPQCFGRLRVHFVGTTYAADAEGKCQVLPVAEEAGVQDYVAEHPGRVPYLDALQLLLDSHALLVVGSQASYYTASKIFPYILAQRPLLALFHEASSVVSILRETQAGELVTFNAEESPGAKVGELAACLDKILTLPKDFQPPTRWEAFEPYTTRAMTARLAQVFDSVMNRTLQNARQETDWSVHSSKNG